ncbi:MAG: hypothetical protein J6386_08340 [Candidatus Synoicihabitans palmerolidicus]|nr:hypothetical protein [Candidatus Synoicihabitans palmerolidicus]
MGFVVDGETSVNVLVRIIGPGLDQWLVGTLADPVLSLFSGETALIHNDNWSGNYGQTVGAFELTSAVSTA